MIPVEEALKAVLDNSPPRGEAAVPLDSAQGLVLAEDVHSDSDLPCIDTAACDGFALRGQELRYEIPLENSAADPASNVLAPGRAYPVRRGDPLPEGSDRVVPSDVVRVEDTVIYLDSVPSPGLNIDPRGNDVGKGQLVLEKGTRLSQQHLGIAAMAGCEVLRVYRRPVTGLLSIGEQFVPSTWRMAPGRRRNPVAPMLKAQLSCSGFSPGVALHASSERERLTSALEQTAACCEVFLAFGGTGSVPAILDELGYSFLFRMVAQHPAGSLACARGPCGQMVFIMQADLLSALVSTEEYVLPCLRSMSGYKGCRKRVFLGETTFEYSKEPDRQHFIGTLAYREGSAWKLHRPEQGGSGDLTGTGSINSLAIAGSQQIGLRNGDPMPFHFLCSAAGEISFA